jgi:carbamoyl-phosphate synthase large subunit
MKSTGEVMGVDRTFPAALAKALIASEMALRPNGGALISVSDRTKADAIPVIKRLHQAGYRLYATEGTAAEIRALGIPVDQVFKGLNDGHPNVLDVINDGTVTCVINTPEGAAAQRFRTAFTSDSRH